jgi:hypothetical protein
VLGFAPHLGDVGVDRGQFLALLAGALVAAPFAAWAVKVLPVRVLGSFVGVMIVLLNVRTILVSIGTPGVAVGAVLLALLAAGAVVVARTVRVDRQEQALLRSREATVVLESVGPQDA